MVVQLQNRIEMLDEQDVTADLRIRLQARTTAAAVSFARYLQGLFAGLYPMNKDQPMAYRFYTPNLRGNNTG